MIMTNNIDIIGNCEIHLIYQVLYIVSQLPKYRYKQEEDTRIAENLLVRSK